MEVGISCHYNVSALHVISFLFKWQLLLVHTYNSCSMQRVDVSWIEHKWRYSESIECNLLWKKIPKENILHQLSERYSIFCTTQRLLSPSDQIVLFTDFALSWELRKTFSPFQENVQFPIMPCLQNNMSSRNCGSGVWRDLKRRMFSRCPHRNSGQTTAP